MNEVVLGLRAWWGRMRLRTHVVRWAAVLLVGCAGYAHAASTATVTISGTAQGNNAASILITFNGYSESLQYDATSTPSSIANALAIDFSRNYLAAGLCAVAYGNVITFKLKTGGIGLLTAYDSNASFQFAGDGFGTEAPPAAKPLTVSWTEIGGTNVSISGVSLTGDTTDFRIVSNRCVGTVVAGGICQIVVNFLPYTRGSKSATLSVVSTGAASPQSVSLGGSW